MRHMSNRERISRAAEEASARAAEKLAKKKAADATPRSGARKSRSKASATPERVKLMWAVHNQNGRAVQSFDYPDKAAAEAETARLTASTGQAHELRAIRQPMD